MENELILWFWRGLLTLGMGGVVRLLIWQRKIERELTEQKVKTANAAGLGDQVRNTATKVTTLEANIAALPEIKTEITACHNQLNDVANTTSVLKGEMRQINNTLNLIQKHLMGQNK